MHNLVQTGYSGRPRATPSPNTMPHHHACAIDQEVVHWLRRCLIGITLGAWCTLAQSQPTALTQTPDVLRSQLAAMDAQAQRRWLADAYAAQQLETASDGQLNAMLQAVDWSVLLSAPQQWLQRNPDYEFLMLRRERLPTAETLPSVPERMWVRYRHQPRALYVQWQKGGPHSGQEVLYDASIDPKSMRAHLGGLLSRLSVTIGIDGMLPRSQSRHTVRDIGFQYILDQVGIDLEKLRARALPDQATVGVVQDGAKRYIEIRLRTPGAPDFYAQSTRIRLDLAQPLLRLVECQDSEGHVFEHIVFDKVQALTPAPDAFDPRNPQYHF